MKLTENKEDISFDKVSDMRYLKEDKLRTSDWRIYKKQKLDLHELIDSNSLINDIYYDIKR